MAKLSEAQTKLLTHATQPGGIYTGMYRPTINALIKKGYLVETSRNQFEATPAGLAYLYQDEPMVDQPQPPSEVETVAVYVPQVGDTVEYTQLGTDDKALGTVIYADYPYYQIDTGESFPLSRHANYIRLIGRHNPAPMLPDIDTLPGRDYAEMLQDDDLPFSDLGIDDTQELPIVKVEAEMSLSQLVDAALLGATPCQRIDALRTLRNGFDWESVPSDALEAEVVDVNQAYEDAVANRRLLSSKMMNDFWGYAELKDYVKAESFTWAVNAVYVLLNKQLSHRRLHAMGAYNA